jgi:hypothetical protein
MIGNKYLNFPEFELYLKINKLPIVPFLYTGPWDKSLLKFAVGKSSIASHIKEGIVIKPISERYDPQVGRVILKHISEAYLLNDYGDNH